MSVLHFGLKVFHGLLANEIAQYAVSVRERGSGSFARNDVAIFLNQLTGVGGRRVEILLEARAAGSFLVVENATSRQYHGRRTDRSDTFALGVVLFQGLTQAFVGVKIRTSRHTTRQ